MDGAGGPVRGMPLSSDAERASRLPLVVYLSFVVLPIVFVAMTKSMTKPLFWLMVEGAVHPGREFMVVGVQVHLAATGGTQGRERWCLVAFLIFIQSRTPAHGIVSPHHN